MFVTVPSRIPYNAIIAATEATCKQLKKDVANYLRKEVSNALHIPADQGNITVVMNKTDYGEMMKLLDDHAYMKLKRDPTTSRETDTQAIKWVERNRGNTRLTQTRTNPTVLKTTTNLWTPQSPQG